MIPYILESLEDRQAVSVSPNILEAHENQPLLIHSYILESPEDRRFNYSIAYILESTENQPLVFHKYWNLLKTGWFSGSIHTAIPSEPTTSVPYILESPKGRHRLVQWLVPASSVRLRPQPQAWKTLRPVWIYGNNLSFPRAEYS